MKLKFKGQSYQTQAVDSVADCFSGQLRSAGGIQYRVDPGRSRPGAQEQSALFDAGFRNAELAISPGALLQNILAVQHRQNLPVSPRKSISRRSMMC